MEPDPLDPVWKALANPVRRKMLDLLRDEPLTTGDLAAAFGELSRFGVMQHLNVLEEAGLIVVKRVGRQRYNYLNAVPIRQIYERWVSRYEGQWASALIALREGLEDEGDAEPGAGSRPSRSKGAKNPRNAKKKTTPKRRGTSTSSKKHGKGGSHG